MQTYFMVKTMKNCLSKLFNLLHPSGATVKHDQGRFTVNSVVLHIPSLMVLSRPDKIKIKWQQWIYSLAKLQKKLS